VVHLWVHAQLREPAPHHCAKGALVEHKAAPQRIVRLR
jgi:hypothetical protein